MSDLAGSPPGRFSARPFGEVVREERFFCFLLAHALLSSPNTRRNFVNHERIRNLVALDAEDLEVFVEATVLRDYWRALGDPVRYDAATHQARYAVLVRLLEHEGVAPSILDEHQVFWTGKPHAPMSKLWSPGRWNPERLADAGVPALVRLRYAFNAKPDLMLIGPMALLLIEAKLEAPEGIYPGEENQYAIQQLILELIGLLVPRYARRTHALTTLDVSGDGLRWSHVGEMLDPRELDTFTVSCLTRIAATT